jgi:MFS family permease
LTLNFHPPRSLAFRNQVAVYVGSFFGALGFSFVMPLLPLFTLELLEGDLAQVGLWVGIAIGGSPLLTALTAPYWGALGDRLGQKRMIQRSLIAIGLATLLMALISHPWQLLGLRGIIGVLGGISVATLAAITASSRKQALGRNIGLLQASQTLGQVVGPLLGGVLAVAVGMRSTFVWAAALFLVGLALVTWLYRDPPIDPAGSAGGAEARESGPGRLGSPGFWATLAVLFTASFIDGGFVVLLPLLLPSLGAPVDSLSLLAGLGLSGAALAIALSAALAGRLTSRFNTGSLMLAMLAASGLVVLALLLTSGWWQLLLLRALLGLLAGGLPTLAYSAAASFVEPRQRGQAVGLASSAALVGWATAPLISGLLFAVNPRVVLVLDLLLLVGCALTIAWLGGLIGWQREARSASGRLALFSR